MIKIIYIYQLKTIKNLEKNTKMNLNFYLKDKNCKAEGILDIEDNFFYNVKA